MGVLVQSNDPIALKVVVGSMPQVRPELKADLYGTCGSPGVAEGPARVIMTEDELHLVEEGDILVAASTSPSWTPIFSMIKGVVVDRGASLSHAAIVGREYGIPVVMNVFEGTAKIKSGQRIKVDANLGTVYILDRCPKPEWVRPRGRLRGASPLSTWRAVAMAEKWIYWFEELRSGHNDMVGKKCANLGEMIHMGLRVPPGFAISVDGYERFMEETGAGEEIRDYVQENRIDLKNSGKANRSQPVHPEHHRVQANARRYEARACSTTTTSCAKPWGCRICRWPPGPAGRSACPARWKPILNVRGRKALVQRIIQVWGSAFTTRAIAFRLEKGMAMEKAPIGVAVLKMVDAKCAGVILTVLPTTGDLSKVVVEGNWGLGESVVSGEITPDSFIVDKDSGEMEATVAKKPRWWFTRTRAPGMTQVPAEIQEVAACGRRNSKKSCGSPKMWRSILTCPRTWNGSLTRTCPFRKISTGFRPGRPNTAEKERRRRIPGGADDANV